MKKIGLILGLFFIFPVIAFADEVEVSTSDDLIDNFLSGGEIKITDDITLSSDTAVYNDTIIDLNGYTITMSDSILFPYASLTIKDTSINNTGSITGSGTYVIYIGTNSKNGELILNSGTIDCSSRSSYCLYIAKNGSLIMNGGNITAYSNTIVNVGNLEVNGGVIDSTKNAVIYGHNDSLTTINGGLIKSNGDWYGVQLSKPGSKLVMNGGKIEALVETGYKGVGIIAFKDTEVIINDGEIHSAASALMGNGSVSGNNEGTNAKFTINGGKLISNFGLGIYAPQPNGETLITGGLIQGATEGIEIRAGKLTVTGGTIIGNKDTYSVISNANGSSITGTAISVVQHNTKLPIEVNILGGTLEGYIPFVEVNALNNSQEDVDKIEITISDGEFNSSSETTVSVEDYSEPFITGGTFTNNVTEYVAENHGERLNPDSVTVLPYRSVSYEEDDDDHPYTDDTNYFEGDEVTLDNIEKEGYLIDDIIITDGSGNIITVTDSTFIMPASNITIKIVYKYIYKILSGADQTFENDDLVIKTNGNLSKLKRIEINDKELSKEFYSVESGSTILSLSKDYLKTLNTGKYTLTFVYEDGDVSTTFTIKDIVNPNTFDNINLYISSIILSMIILLINNKVKKQS